MGNDKSRQTRNTINEINDTLYYESEAEDRWRRKIGLDKLKRQKRNGAKIITKRLAALVESYHQVSSHQKQPQKPQKQDGMPKERKVTKRKDSMSDKKISQAWVIGETLIWSVFIIVMAMIGLYMMKVVKLSDHTVIWLGRVSLAFSLLALLDLAYIASRQRSY